MSMERIPIEERTYDKYLELKNRGYSMDEIAEMFGFGNDMIRFKTEVALAGFDRLRKILIIEDA